MQVLHGCRSATQALCFWNCPANGFCSSACAVYALFYCSKPTTCWPTDADDAAEGGKLSKAQKKRVCRLNAHCLNVKLCSITQKRQWRVASCQRCRFIVFDGNPNLCSGIFRINNRLSLLRHALQTRRARTASCRRRRRSAPRLTRRPPSAAWCVLLNTKWLTVDLCQL